MMCLLAVILTSIAALASANGGWKDGRATFYGLDGWSIHKGACGFGYQWPDVYPGFDTVAISDASSDFGGSCGRCYEVKCRNNGGLKDGYGKQIDRSGACYDESKSVVVRTVDACPCNYPGNAYSNKRWCCGDSGSGSGHLDLSIWAFEKLASTSNGVISLQYREVSCDYQPSNPATVRGKASPPEKPEQFNAKRPEETVYVKRFDSFGTQQGAVSQVENGKEPWAPVVPVEKIYRDGTLSGASDSSRGSSDSSSSSDDNGCDDKAPNDGTSCAQRKDWGNCKENWMLKDNLCRETCGRCSSTSSSSKQSDGSSKGSSKSSSGCDDKEPAAASCKKHKQWGNCGQKWIKDGGYCKATCGLCTVESFDGKKG